MADDISTEVTTDVVDTGTEVAVDTDQDEDIGLEDIEVDESAMESPEDDDEEESESESEDEEDDTTDDAETAEDAESDDDAEPEAEQTDAEKRKAHNAEMAQRRIAEKQQRDSRVQQAQAAYIAEAKDAEDPLELAVRELQVTNYNNTVERVENTVTNDYQRALNDFGVLRTDDPVIQAEIDAALDAFQAQFVTIDAYGNATAVKGSLYATLQAKAASIEKLTGIRGQKQTKSKGKEKSKTLTTPTRAPKEPKVDPDIAAFDEEAYGKSS